MPEEVPKKWWKESTVYQIYPSSFKDSNGDGEGDIPGIISKVDYIASLGTDAVWLSPCYKSPQIDMGYDISDYEDIHPPYGTLKDVDTLIMELKKRNIKLLMDLVVNHTSDQHPWFLESKSSKTSPKREWYMWRKGKTGPNGERRPPNNWESIFKGSAWEYDPSTDEYYFHFFMIAQPCLNWENPEVRSAIYDMMHFWLRKGLGGLRMDAVNLISKDPKFPDAPVTEPDHEYQDCFKLVGNRPQVHTWLKEMKEKVLDHYPDIVTIGECGGTDDIDETKRYIMPSRAELDLIFQFELTGIDVGPQGVFSGKDWSLADLKSITAKWQTVLRPAWNTFHLENHDSGRSVNRYGRTTDPKHFPAVSKLIAFFSMTLGGTIFLHQGQELGAQNLTDDIGLEAYKDRATHQDVQKHRQARVLSAGIHEDQVDMSDVMTQVRLKARDHARVPMAWDAGPGAGFSSHGAEPWMTLNSDHLVNNVAVQEGDPASVLNVWREMIRFRKENPDELVYGEFALVDEPHGEVMAYTRTSDAGNSLLIALNWSDKTVLWEMSAGWRAAKVLKMVGAVKENDEGVQMEPYACACWQVSGGVESHL